MKTSSASSASNLSPYQQERAAFVASAILHERQGSTGDLPSGAMHCNVQLRKVLERTCITTGSVTRFILDKDAPLAVPYHEQGDTVFISDESVFTERTLAIFNSVREYAFTLTEEEYDHEQYHREA